MADFTLQKFQTKTDKLLKIRHFQLEDLEEIQRFFKRGTEETSHTPLCKEKPISENKIREKVETAMLSQSEIYIGVFDQKEIVGSLQFRVSSPDHPWVKHIGEFGMLVLKSHWHQGIGKKLLKIMEEFALQNGVARIESKVRCNNERGIALYLGRGFKVEGIRERGAFIEGKFIDEYFISKLLEVHLEKNGLV